MKRNTRARNHRNQKNKKYSDIDHKKVTQTLIPIVVILLLVFISIATCYYFKNRSSYQNLVDTSRQEIENKEKEDAKNEELNKNNEEKPSDTTFTMTAVGDIMCHNTQYKDAYNSETNTYDFSYVFENISSHTKTADICIGNLETTFAGEDRGYSSYPRFNTPDSLAYELKSIGFDVLSTAGNHALDMGYDGLSRTINVLNDADISHLGTYTSQEEQDKVLIKFVKGLKIAFINYTYGTNGIPVPSDKNYCVNLNDKELIKKHIDTAKSKNADIIVACMHWGTEYQTKQNSSQEELADFLIQNGVNIILGTHPHVLQPYEKKTVTLDNGSIKEGFVVYSLGNFISDQNAKYTRDSIILNLTITKHVDGTVSVDKVEPVPIYMYKDTSAKNRKMKLVDINKIIYNYENYLDDSISENFYNLMKKELNNINSIISK